MKSNGLGDYTMYQRVFEIPSKTAACFGHFNYWKPDCYTCEEMRPCKLVRFFIPMAPVEKLPQYLSSTDTRLREAAEKRLTELTQ